MERSRQAGRAGRYPARKRQRRILTAARTTPLSGPCGRTISDARHEHEPSRENRLTQDENAGMVPHRAVVFCPDGEAPTTSNSSS